MFFIDSPQWWLESGYGLQFVVTQLSLFQLTTSPSVHFSDFNSCGLRSRPQIRNRVNLPNRGVNGTIRIFPIDTGFPWPRVRVPLGWSLQLTGQTEEDICTSLTRRKKIRLAWHDWVKCKVKSSQFEPKKEQKTVFYFLMAKGPNVEVYNDLVIISMWLPRGWTCTFTGVLGSSGGLAGS